jgi:hypothetical protein
MKNNDLNKNKFYIRLTILLSVLLIASTSISLMTGGFTVWDRFFNKTERIPHLKVQVEPMVIDFDSAYVDNLKATLFFFIETSGGIYEIDNKITIDKFTVIDKNDFCNVGSSPEIVLNSITIDKFILDPGFPNLGGLLKFKLNFILTANEFSNLTKGEDILIASFQVVFPYSFEGKKYYEISDVPVYIRK